MIGIVVPCYNRPEYLWWTIESLKASLCQDGKDIRVIFVDDGSTDISIDRLLSGLLWHKQPHGGVKEAIKNGMSYMLALDDIDYYMILDSDAVVRKDFIEQIISLPKDGIATGFHCTTKNRDGSERHTILSETPTYFTKKSVGGINMAFTRETYNDYILPALNSPGNWDHNACINIEKSGKSVYCVKESVVQHIGTVSSMGHGITEAPDVADDFYLHNLSNVTLIGVSTNNYDGLIRAKNRCTQYIRFGDVKMLGNKEMDGFTVIDRPIKSKSDYNHFCVEKLVDYVDTEYMLIFQPDGYIINPLAFEPVFFDYDYVGAVWNWYKEGNRVGNGGFSLRRTDMMEAIKKDEDFILKNEGCHNYEEDHNICRVQYKYLTSRYGFSFSPEHIANKFSVENYGVPSPMNKYNGSFGFHGFGNIDFSESYIKP